jgi:hypothetical protein
MYTLITKELRQYFSGLLGYITIGVFLLATSVYLFLLPNSNILDSQLNKVIKILRKVLINNMKYYNNIIKIIVLHLEKLDKK